MTKDLRNARCSMELKKSVFPLDLMDNYTISNHCTKKQNTDHEVIKAKLFHR